MNPYEELLARASACLSQAEKIEDPVVRTEVLDLVYQAQLVAQAGILREVEGALPNPDPASAAGSSGQPSRPLAR
jgi:hypothetical protein